MGEARIVYRVHAVQRMFERRVTPSEVERAASVGELIEEYPDDTPYPSRLMLGFVGERPLHVVVADNARAHELIIITVYEPDPGLWNASFRRRKS